MKQPRSQYLVAVALLVLVAFFIRAASLDAQSLWRDEVDALRFAQAPWSEMLSNFTRPGWNGPLYYLMLRGWIALTGQTEYAMRFFSLIFGVLGVPLIYTLGRRLFDRTVGLIAALLVTTSPYLTWYSQEVRMYTWVPALAMLAIYALHRALSGSPLLSSSKGNGWHWWMVQIVATTLAFYSHILAAFLVPVQVLLYFAWWPQARQHWKPALISLACLTLPYLPLAVWQAPLALQARETGFQAYTLGRMVEILLNAWSTGMRSWGWPWGAILMALGAVSGIIDPSASWRDRLALLVWLTIPLLSVWLISLRQPLFTDRYLIWSAPAFYLLIALGLASLRRLGAQAHFLIVALASALLIFNSVNLWQQATTPIKSDFRAAAAYVANYEPPGQTNNPHLSESDLPFKLYLPLIVAERGESDELIIFQIPYARYTFDYYFPIEDYTWADGLYTNHRAPDGTYLKSEEEVAWRMEEVTKGYDAIWLIASETPMWDERNLVQTWLDEHAQRVTEEHFARVDVYRYEK